MGKRFIKAAPVAIFMALLLSAALVRPVAYGEAIQEETAENGDESRWPGLFAESPAEFVAPEKKTVYLTFDDGPSRNTEALLDILREEGVRATFFVCAQYEDQEYSQKMLRRMRDEGHTIGLHSYTHDTGKIYRSMDSWMDDLERLNSFVFEATGCSPDILRFPGGSTTVMADRGLMKNIAGEMTSRGYTFYDWTVASGDDGAHAAPVQTLTDNVLGRIKDRQVEIILFHDNQTPVTTPDAVRALIPALRARGYEFDALTSQVPPVQLIYTGGC